jgi:hypothetical protein
MDIQVLTSVAMGIALSACCGFRVFIPLLGTSVAGYLGWYVLPAEMQWMSTVTALLCFGTAAVIEVLAYYIPFVDNLLDTIATPLAVGAGTLLAASFLPFAEISPLVKWVLALLSGGAAAGTIQLGSGMVRLGASKFTAGTGNPVVATVENISAIGGTVLSFIIPVIIAVLLVLFILLILSQVINRLFRRTNSGG